MKLAENTELIEQLKSGGVAVIRTDTLYGLVASAANENAVKRVYTIKNRNPSKSCIILVDTTTSAYGNSETLAQYLPSSQEQPTSVLIEGKGAPEWLLRQNTELAYRVPVDEELRDFLAITGPLIAPSANPEGMPPALTIAEAKDYFGNKVDIYVDGGEVSADTPPSRLIRIHADGRTERLR